jgi:hypothetical protein
MEHYWDGNSGTADGRRGRVRVASLLLTLAAFSLVLLILGVMCEARAETIAVRCFLVSMIVWAGWLAGRKDLSGERGSRRSGSERL